MNTEFKKIREFDRGALIEVRKESAIRESQTHAYYVPHRARELVALRRVRDTDSMDEFQVAGENNEYDWDKITNTVSAEKIAEQAEETVRSHIDGDVGAEEVSRFCLRSNSNKYLAPDVVKFGDRREVSRRRAHREPVERGRLWAILRDQISEEIDLGFTKDQFEGPRYQNQTQNANARRAVLPVSVISEGTKAMVMYMAAHDHYSRMIGHELDMDTENVEEILESALHDEKAQHS